MDHTVLGRTNLDVSVACLGTGGHSRLGQAYGLSHGDSVAVVRAALARVLGSCTTADLESGTGDPTELALLRAADHLDGAMPAVERREATYHFDPRLRLMSVIVPDGSVDGADKHFGHGVRRLALGGENGRLASAKDDVGHRLIQ